MDFEKNFLKVSKFSCPIHTGKGNIVDFEQN